jgi:hypothetical protein
VKHRPHVRPQAGQARSSGRRNERCRRRRHLPPR